MGNCCCFGSKERNANPVIGMDTAPLYETVGDGNDETLSVSLCPTPTPPLALTDDKTPLTLLPNPSTWPNGAIAADDNKSALQALPGWWSTWRPIAAEVVWPETDGSAKEEPEVNRRHVREAAQKESSSCSNRKLEDGGGRDWLPSNRNARARRRANYRQNLALFCRRVNLFSRPAEHNVPRRGGASFSEICLPGRLRVSAKYTSCGTLFLGDTTAQYPDAHRTLSCIASVVHIVLTERYPGEELLSQGILDQRAHPFINTRLPGVSQDPEKMPSESDVSEFLMALFKRVELPAQCTIVFFIYLDRILARGEVKFNPVSWRWLFVGLALLVSKVWMDEPWWNVDYSVLVGGTLSHVNELEQQVVLFLDVNLHVDKSVYTEYYFNLMSLAENRALSSAYNEPLTKDRAEKLGAISRETNRHKKRHMRRAKSLNNLTSLPKPTLAFLPF